MRLVLPADHFVLKYDYFARTVDFSLITGVGVAGSALILSPR